MSELKWTTAKPTKPGWWWYKDSNREPEIVVITINSMDGHLYATGLNARGLFSQGSLRNSHGRWSSSPIEEPE